MVRLGLDVAADSFTQDVEIVDGMDVTNLLTSFNEWYPRPLLTPGAPEAVATVDVAIGPGGGNPYVLFDFPTMEAAKSWFVNVYSEGSGMGQEELDDDFAWALCLPQ